MTTKKMKNRFQMLIAAAALLTWVSPAFGMQETDQKQDSQQRPEYLQKNINNPSSV